MTVYWNEKALLWIIIVALLDLRFCQDVSAMSCKNCDGSVLSSQFPYNNDCFDNPDLVDSCIYGDYCSTQLISKDGLTTEVRRACRSGPMPLLGSCTTSFPKGSSGDAHNIVEATSCNYYCNESINCNTSPTISDFKPCFPACTNNGHCDYIVGKCTCDPGYFGRDCSEYEKNQRMCIQCNNGTDGSSCYNPNESMGTLCPGGESFCTSAKTQVLSNLGEIIKSTITRGCSLSASVGDQCFYSNPADSSLSGYIEYTCLSSCDTDNCNTGIPDGVISDGEEKSLYCFQTASLNSRTLCPAGSTHCYVRVEYFVSDKNDLTIQADPEYHIISEVRGCLSSALASSSCETFAVTGSSARRVVCEESCQGDGCNDGWPSRPKCVTCKDTVNSGNIGSCLLSSFSAAQRCQHPYQKFCYTKEEKVIESGAANDYSWNIERGCSYESIGNECQKFTQESISIQRCNSTCNTDGCNIGLSNHSGAHIADLIFSVAIPMFAILLNM